MKSIKSFFKSNAFQTLLVSLYAIGLCGLILYSIVISIAERYYGPRPKTDLVYTFFEESGGYQKILKSKISYQYDKANEIIVASVYDNVGALVRKVNTQYNKKGMERESIYNNANGKLEKKIISEYDDKDKLTEKNEFDANGKASEKTIYEYDSKGKLIKFFTYDAGGKLIAKEIFKYDYFGREIESSSDEFDANGELATKIIYTHKFEDDCDEESSLIETCKATYNANGKFSSKEITRFIEKTKKQQEITTYKIAEKFGEVEEIPKEQIVREYETGRIFFKQ